MMMNTDYEVVTKGNKTKVLAIGQDYYPNIKGKFLLSLKDTQNGLIAKFKSHSSCQQDFYICLDYSQAEMLRLALNKLESTEE